MSTGMTSDSPAVADIPADDGPQTRGPERRCIATAVSGPKDRLIRFVADPGGVIVPDLAEKLPGRGAWVGASREALDQAIKRKAFARSLKRSVSVPSDLSGLVERLLSQRFLARLGLFRRSGRLVTGFETVCDRLRAGKAQILIEAADGADDGRTKVLKLAAKATPGILVCALVRSDELGRALGQSAVVHAALASDEDVSTGMDRDIMRLAGFRVPWPWGDGMAKDHGLREALTVPVPWPGSATDPGDRSGFGAR